MRYYTPEEYVLANLIEYPSLYKSPTLHDTSLLVFDQLFNVIGNGISDDEELDEYLAYKDFDASLAEKYFTNESLFYGYYKTIKYGKFEIGDADGCNKGTVLCLESEKHLYPDIVKWVISSNAKFNPYPNFQKEYSLVYRTDFGKLGTEWIRAAKWFYRSCETFFNEAETVGYYHNAFPKVKARDNERYISDLVGLLKKIDLAQVEEQYGVPFNGSVEDFAKARWEKELNRINVFLGETQEHLNALIDK